NNKEEQEIMKFKRNLLILSAILIGILIVIPGCLPTTPTTEEEEEAADAPTNGTISVAGGAATTNDTTPTLTLSSTGATYMAFSGDNVNWSAWVAYATTYSSFGVTTAVAVASAFPAESVTAAVGFTVVVPTTIVGEAPKVTVQILSVLSQLTVGLVP
ncbi:unnamed protein product, partial [marine sediment metagenome]